MKVTNDPNGQVSPVRGRREIADLQQKRQERAQRAEPLVTDEVELSASAQELRMAEKAVADSPDIRADVVNRMKMRVRNNALRVEPEKIADRLVDER